MYKNLIIIIIIINYYYTTSKISLQSQKSNKAQVYIYDTIQMLTTQVIPQLPNF